MSLHHFIYSWLHCAEDCQDDDLLALGGPLGGKATSSDSGYIAVATVLVVSAVVVLLGVTTTLLSVSQMQTGLSYTKSARALALAESCAEIALLDLRRDNQLATSISLPSGTCAITTVAQSGALWTFTVSGLFDGYAKTIEITADRGSMLEITSWREL